MRECEMCKAVAEAKSYAEAANLGLGHAEELHEREEDLRAEIEMLRKAYRQAREERDEARRAFALGGP